jgi:hypothetical protein
VCVCVCETMRTHVTHVHVVLHTRLYCWLGGWCAIWAGNHEHVRRAADVGGRGWQVKVRVDFVKPAEDGYEERVCVTLTTEDGM